MLGFEALARWRHPKRGMLQPDLFMPVAEETGLIEPIGGWMLSEACRQVREWQRKHPRGPTLGMSVNVSTRQLSQGRIAAEVERVLGATGLDPASLTLEITESALMHDLNAGAGHGAAPARHVRAACTWTTSAPATRRWRTCTASRSTRSRSIDRSSSQMDRAPQQAAIVKAIVSLAHNLGMEVVAEGVETRAQADALRALRCHRGQGFLFSKPLPAHGGGAAADCQPRPAIYEPIV